MKQDKISRDRRVSAVLRWENMNQGTSGQHSFIQSESKVTCFR